jgi:predicted aconitase with swiveling domain
MRKLVLRGRKIYGGAAQGRALVTKAALGGMGVFDVYTGIVTERGNDWEGQSVAGKILVYKTGRGSSSWAAWHQQLRLLGVAPLAHVIAENNPQTALGAVLSRIPVVAELDQDPTEVIKTGDWVRVDGDNGIVEVLTSD